MKCAWIVAVVVAVVGANACRAQEGVDKAKATVFDARMFGGPMKDDRSALIRLERIRIWKRNKPDDDASNDLVAGADDRIFRVDRADLHECSELVTGRKELAALRHK